MGAAMKLNTSVKLAQTELALSVVAVAAAIYANLLSPLVLGRSDRLLGRLSMVIFFGTLCFAAWQRLARKRARLTERGPDALDEQPLWTPQRVVGGVGVAMVVMALLMALLPALNV